MCLVQAPLRPCLVSVLLGSHALPVANHVCRLLRVVRAASDAGMVVTFGLLKALLVALAYWPGSVLCSPLIEGLSERELLTLQRVTMVLLHGLREM